MLCTKIHLHATFPEKCGHPYLYSYHLKPIIPIQLTHNTWYHTEVPPKSIWKSVKLSFTPIKQYFCTSGLVYVQSSGSFSGHKLETQLNCETISGGVTISANLKKSCHWLMIESEYHSIPSIVLTDKARLGLLVLWCHTSNFVGRYHLVGIQYHQDFKFVSSS